MRQDIAFNAEGVTLRGWLYLPDHTAGPVSTIVMAHGFSAVKEMYLDAFAEVFVQAGFGALVFDNRNFGASDGAPRQEIDPWQQVRDYRHAITHACTLPTVDATRIGIWGSSYSGGHVLVVGAIDRRVRCVVSQVPLISGHRNARRLIRADFIVAAQAQFDEDRRRRFAGEPPATIPVVAENPRARCALPTADSWQWFTETGRIRAPAWRNEVTLRSVEMYTEYEPGAYIGWVTYPAPAGRGPRRSSDRRGRSHHGIQPGAGAEETRAGPGRPFRRLCRWVCRGKRCGAGLVCGTLAIRPGVAPTAPV